MHGHVAVTGAGQEVPHNGGSMPRQASTPDDNRPFHEIRHRNIRATVWRNDTVKGPMYNVTVSRSYRDGEQWKDSHSFAFDDLMNLAKALYDAHSFISAQQARDHDRTRPDGRRESRPAQ
jgi:hypothetical protein